MEGDGFGKLDCTWASARAGVENGNLVVSTGRVRRVWRWHDAGPVTLELRELSSGRRWAGVADCCDWQWPFGAEPHGAVLRRLTAAVSDDEGFTSRHIAVAADIDYPAAGLALRWTIWAYPDAPGLRTQLAARRLAGCDLPAQALRHPWSNYEHARVEALPCPVTGQQRRYFGYHNDTQNRNDTHLHLLKEEVAAHAIAGREWCDWASGACLEDGRGGLALIKESHKCVNQRGHATGGFICDDRHGLLCTGWGLFVPEIPEDDYCAGWATWCVVWQGGDLARTAAVKRFDRLRYPVDPARDIYIQANTWGSSAKGADARLAAGQASVLQELDACAAMGIDVLQIDDGWQVPPGHCRWEPEDNGWRPHPASHPGGWGVVRAHARERGVKLGLWAAALPISLEELKANREAGGFVQFKLDFARLNSRSAIDELMRKVRAFIRDTGHKVRVNWDVTEHPPRYGYFFAREYGSIYLENRKPMAPQAVVYRPHTVLRDLWQTARYLNLNRFQCPIQNIELVNPERSDAAAHSHAYATALALMGIPLFFTETKYYNAKARSEIRRVLDVYKQHRERMFGGIVYPIGACPDNASWTGFQCHLAEEDCGYLAIFRERCNPLPETSLQLAWLDEGDICLTDLLAGVVTRQRVDRDGRVDFRIAAAPGFLFMRYDRETGSTAC